MYFIRMIITVLKTQDIFKNSNKTRVQISVVNFAFNFKGICENKMWEKS